MPARSQSHRNISCRHVHFFPKNDMILPCPALAAGFFAFVAVEEDCIFGFGGGAGSSSEKDSHTGSSFVTVLR
jgi:hypothetical protein